MLDVPGPVAGAGAAGCPARDADELFLGETAGVAVADVQIPKSVAAYGFDVRLAGGDHRVVLGNTDRICDPPNEIVILRGDLSLRQSLGEGFSCLHARGHDEPMIGATHEQQSKYSRTVNDVPTVDNSALG